MSLSAKSFTLFQRDVFLFLTNLVTGIIVARVLGPESLGLWAILQLIPSYAESFGRMKFDVAAVYYLGKGKYKIGDVVFTLNVLALITSFTIITIILWQSDWLYHTLFANSRTNVKYLMFLVLPQIPLHFLYMNYSYLFIHREDVNSYNRMVVLQALCSSIGGIALVVIFKLGLKGVVIASTVSIFVSVFYGVYKFGPVKRKHLINWPLIKDLFSYVNKLYIAGVIGHINSYFTNLIVALYLLPAQVAFYSMAQSRAQLLEKVPNAMSTILFPRISKMDNMAHSAELSAKAFRTSLTILLIAGFIAFIMIKPLVGILYGRDFLPMVIPFWIILPGLILSSSSTTLSQFFQGTGRADIIAKVAVIPMIIQIIVSLLLIPKIGILGAAIAFMMSLVANAITQIFFFLRISQLSFKKHLLIGREDILLVWRFLISVVVKYLPVRIQKFVGMRTTLDSLPL